MTLDQLKYFLEAAKFQHLGKAARSAAISPSAVSSAIAALEEQYRCQLFERHGKGLRLTERGQYLKIQAEKIFDEVLSIEAALGTERAAMSGSYRVGASHFLCPRYLAPAWFELRKKHPGIHGEIRSMSTAQLVSEVVSGAMDFGLCFSPLRHPDLKQLDIAKGQMHVAVRKGHPLLALKPKESMARLSHYPATTHKAAPGVDICETHEVFDRYGIIPKTDCFFDSDEIAVKSLLSSDSWALLPDIVIESFSKSITAIAHPKDWSAPYSVSAIIRLHRTENNALRLLCELLEKRARD